MRSCIVHFGNWLIVGGLVLGAATASAQSPDEGLPDPAELGSESADSGGEEAAESDEPTETARRLPRVGPDEPDESDAAAGETPETGADDTESGDPDDERLPDPSEVEPGDDSDGERWRVETDDRPPIQVRRAVDRIRASARSIAGSVAEKRAAEEHDSSSKPKVRRLERGASNGSQSRAGRSKGTPSTGEILGTVRRLFRDSPDRGVSLEPYVDDPRWDHAMQALYDDDCREALDRVDTVLEESERDLKRIPAVRYAVARIKLCAGQPAEGRRTLRKLRKRGGTVGRLARRILGKPPRPIQTEGGGGDRWVDDLREARELAREGEPGRAVELLGELEQRVDHGWKLYKVELTGANILLRDGRIEDAARELAGLYRMVRDWNLADRVVSKIQNVEDRHDIEILTLGSRVDRMRELILQGDYHEAKEVSVRNAKLAGVSGAEIRGWSLYRRGVQAEHAHRRDKAIELFEQAEELVDSSVIRPRLYFGWARALRRRDRDDEAIELYRRLCREYPRQHLCDDAQFEIGRLNQYSNRHERARRAFEKLVGMHPGSEHVPQALWRGAFSAYLTEDYEAVDRPLHQLARHYPEETDASGLPLALKARYWLGVAAFKRGDIEAAKRRFQRTINTGALTWYGRLAARRLERIGAEPIVPRPPREVAPREIHDLASLHLPENPRYAVAAAYARLGLYENAIAEVERQMEVAPVPDKAHRFLANLKLVDGQRAEAHWTMAERIDSPAPTPKELRVWGIAYPMEFREPARTYATKYDVSPYLVQAVMRQESGFRPAVSSGVGAVGLMQLMPGTANVLSDDFFDGAYVDREQLQQPETNVRMGTAYVRALISWAKGRVPLALAGYNAGPAPLKDWMERFGDREMDAWVESITYRQARGYVRHVYTAFVRYKALYGGKLPDVRITLPDELGDWGDVPELHKQKTPEAVSLRSR